MRAESLEGASFVFNHTQIAKNRHDYYFPRQNTAPYLALLTTAASQIEVAKEPRCMKAGLRKPASNFPCRGGRKNGTRH